MNSKQVSQKLIEQGYTENLSSYKFDQLKTILYDYFDYLIDKNFEKKREPEIIAMLKKNKLNEYAKKYSHNCCIICEDNTAVEDREHLLLHCKSLQPIRDAIEQCINEMIQKITGKKMTIFPFFRNSSIKDSFLSEYNTIGYKELQDYNPVQGALGLLPLQIVNVIKEKLHISNNKAKELSCLISQYLYNGAAILYNTRCKLHELAWNKIKKEEKLNQKNQQKSQNNTIMQVQSKQHTPSQKSKLIQSKQHTPSQKSQNILSPKPPPEPPPTSSTDH